MIVGLDTSVLLRLLVGEPQEMALAALGFLLERQKAGDRLQVSDLVLAEAYHAVQHHYGADRREALDGLRAFLGTPGVEVEPDVTEVLGTPNLESAKPGFVDRVIHRRYLRSGAERMATFEKAAGKLTGVIVLRS